MRRLFHPDQVVFKAEVGINILLALIMAEDDLGAVGKGEEAAGRIEPVRQGGEEPLAEGREVFEIRFADLPEEEAFEAGNALAVIGAELGKEPVRFAAAPGPAVADGGGAGGVIAEPGGGAGGQLARLEADAGADEFLDLVGHAPGLKGVLSVLIGIEHRIGFQVEGSAGEAGGVTP